NCNWPRAGTHHVSRSFRHDQLRSLARIRGAVTTIAIECHRQCASSFLDPDDGSISAGQDRGVGPYHVIILAIDPVFGSDVAGRKERQKIAGVIFVLCTWFFVFDRSFWGWRSHRAFIAWRLVG